MSWFKKAVTAPVKTVKVTSRLLKEWREAEKLQVMAEEAAQHPELYRDPNWLSRFIRQCAALWEVLPLPEALRMNTLLANWKTTSGGLATLLFAAASIMQDPTNLTDPKVLAMIAAGVAAIMAKDHNVTGGTKDQTK